MDTVAVAPRRAPGSHVDLDVRPLQPRIATQEGAGKQSGARHQPASAKRVLHADHELTQLAARQIIQRNGLREAVAAIGVEVIMQVGAHRRHVAHNGDPGTIQHFGRPEAGELQQVRRAIGSAGDDDFAIRACGAQAL